MSSDPTRVLATTYWVGGAPDAGKSTVTDLLAERHGLSVYHYDSTDLAHHERLAAMNPDYLAFIDANLDQRWVDAEPADLLRRSLASFRDRWPMVLEDLHGCGGTPLIAEGFGLLPELLAELPAPQTRCVFLNPTPEFKAMSIVRRDKPTWRHQTRDPGRARRNLLARDELLSTYILDSARNFGLPVISVHTDTTPDEVASVVGSLLGL